jgi:hypothetical protein
MRLLRLYFSFVFIGPRSASYSSKSIFSSLKYCFLISPSREDLTSYSLSSLTGVLKSILMSVSFPISIIYYADRRAIQSN